MNIKKELRSRLLKESSGYEYGCVMLYLPIEKSWWGDITSEIDEDDIYEEKDDDTHGIQPYNEAHITILYGIHSNVPDEDVEVLIDKMTSPEVTLKEISIFENGDKGFDVVKFDVEGEGLHKMNKMFRDLPHTSSYPDYHPHTTIAYVKSGSGKKYVRNLSDDDALTIKANKIVYSKPSGEKKEYSIK